MIELVAWCLIAFGVTYVVGHSQITRGMREWLYAPKVDERGVPVEVNRWARLVVDLMECPACFGFHVGWIGYLLGFRILATDLGVIADAIAFGFLTSGSNLLLARASGLIGDAK